MSSDGCLIKLLTGKITKMSSLVKIAKMSSMVKSVQQGVLSSAEISSLISPDISVARTEVA